MELKSTFFLMTVLGIASCHWFDPTEIEDAARERPHIFVNAVMGEDSTFCSISIVSQGDVNTEEEVQACVTLEGASEAETTVSNVFSGRPTRVLANRMVRRLGPMNKDAPAFPKGFAAFGPLCNAAERIGKRDFSAHYCGQSVALGRRSSAYALTGELASNAQRYLEALCNGRRRAKGPRSEQDALH